MDAAEAGSFRAMSTVLPQLMSGVHLTGHGDVDRLVYREDIPIPVPADDQVLIEVTAAGVNNTDINTRLGWYSKSVDGATGEMSDGDRSVDVADDGSWSGIPLTFPRIQGADMAGRIVAVGSSVDPKRLGQRVLVRPIHQSPWSEEPVTIGSEYDGGFAQFCAAPSRETYAIESDMTDIELASFPCAYSTAEGMLHRAGVTEGERVVITGASGGVGSAAVQLAARRGADVIAVASTSKWDAVRALGAHELLDRSADLVAELGVDAADVAVDVVAGPGFGALLDVLRPEGRYVTSGAIAGPIVDLDVRTVYLKDLTLIGSTRQDRVVFENLVSYIERREIEPVVAATYPLSAIRDAQRDFLAKGFAGKLVLIPHARL